MKKAQEEKTEKRVREENAQLPFKRIAITFF
jgi:hypothetical protein